jgi:hypothetical protein
VISPTQTPLPDNTQHKKQTSIRLAGFKPAIAASERPQTHALDGAAAGIGTAMRRYEPKWILVTDNTTFGVSVPYRILTYSVKLCNIKNMDQSGWKS